MRIPNLLPEPMLNPHLLRSPKIALIGFLIWSLGLAPARAQTPGDRADPEHIARAGRLADIISGGDPATFTRAFIRAANMPDTIVTGALNAKTPLFSQPNFLPLDVSQGMESMKASTNQAVVSKYLDAELATNLKKMLGNPGIYIWEGKPTGAGEFKDCVAVNDGTAWRGSGVLISKNVVLTAAHCGIPSGVGYVGIGHDVGSAHKIYVKYADPYPSTSPMVDLAILVLEKDVTDAETLPIASSVDGSPALKIVGFGMTSNDSNSTGIKFQGDVPIIPNTCNDQSQQIFGCNPGIELVAKGPVVTNDTCHGDSGGPGYVGDPDNRLLGVVTLRSISHTPTGKLDCGYGGVYLRLQPYIEWIKDEVTKYGASAPQVR